MTFCQKPVVLKKARGNGHATVCIPVNFIDNQNLQALVCRPVKLSRSVLNSVAGWSKDRSRGILSYSVRENAFENPTRTRNTKTTKSKTIERN